MSEPVIVIDELGFKNFLQYGNTLTVYKTKQGITRIGGENGTGKCLRGNTTIEVTTDDLKVMEKFIDFMKIRKNA